MQLKQYWEVLRRHWWLLVLLPVLAAIFSILTHEDPPVTYAYQLKYSISFIPLEREGVEQDPVLTAVQASEYITDDLTEVLRGSEFTALVQERVPEGVVVPSLANTVRAAKTHRILTLDFTTATEEEAAALGRAIQQAIDEDVEGWLNEVWGIGNIRLELIHDSGPVAMGGGLRSRLDIPLRVALALVAATALAFALDYLDDSVRSREEAEKLLGPVLAEIPLER